MLNLLSMPRTGRPKKPPEEKFVGRHIKFPPDLWTRLEALVPEKARAQFIRGAVDEALRRLARRQRRQGDEEGEGAE